MRQPLSSAPYCIAIYAMANVHLRKGVGIVGLLLSVAAILVAPAASANWASLAGPFNSSFLEGGIGQTYVLSPSAAARLGESGVTLRGWLNIAEIQPGARIVAGLCPQSGLAGCVSVVIDRGRLRPGFGQIAAGQPPLSVGVWHAFELVCGEASARLFIDGVPLPDAGVAICPRPGQRLVLAPVPGAAEGGHFGGSLAGLEVAAGAATDAEIRAWAAHPPTFSLVQFVRPGIGWPLQTRQWTGLSAPQPAWTLPAAQTAPDPPTAKPIDPTLQTLHAEPDSHWSLERWRLAEAGTVHAPGEVLSNTAYDDSFWWPATVPGTVLTTLIDRGVYPDPDHGLNNMAIPERLARQDYWYRTQFDFPAAWEGKRLLLTFNGINYAADIWLNGRMLGTMRGAFLRGRFEIADRLRSGKPNVLAVHVHPPPDPGIPSEESLKAGAGENGGRLALDGPTFIATEGWDWIPGIRDRDTGLWQGVDIHATGALRLLDPKIVTRLTLPQADSARITIDVPIRNDSAEAAEAAVDAQFGPAKVRKRVFLPPGESVVRLDPVGFPQLILKSPRLWWPNGYGKPDLYNLALSVGDGQLVSDRTQLRFGIREITYELSLFDHIGHLRRVEIDPALADELHQRVIDTRHEAIKQTPNGWAASLTEEGEASPAVRPVAHPHGMAPFLTIIVNGVPIAARGGSWGMDDSRKRSSRARLEPFFKLHQQANINVIRNWLGQNTEEDFYDLADEYGLLVLNDFWESTQDFQLEAEDPQLFLQNASDVINRFRNHPSIAVWFGRNEGVPQPILNEGLASLVRESDGTRLYMASSNRVNLWDSGPYNYRPPEAYFTGLAEGFAVEVGTPSLSTLESLEASIPAPDRWPISDTLAYHDWHQDGNGDVGSFMAALRRQFGPPESLADFERKAQMLNYVSYRAIFEGFWAGLWQRNSGRLLWMTHPAWPSNHWQIYSADMDTQASYYGVKKALEKLHVQMNLPDFVVAVVNTTRNPERDLRVHSEILTMAGKVLLTRDESTDAVENATTTLDPLPVTALLQSNEVLLVSLSLRRPDGTQVSRNLYWQGRTEDSFRGLAGMKQQMLTVSATEDNGHITATLRNAGDAPALAAKITLLDEAGQRILPAYFSDNYVSLLPGEARVIAIDFPSRPDRGPHLAIRGWNVKPQLVWPKPRD
jgi:hypothetical protein